LYLTLIKIKNQTPSNQKSR